MISGVFVRVFFLVVARLAGLFMTAPILNSKIYSSRVKIALIFWLAVIMAFVVPQPETIPQFSFYFILILINEVLIGALIGAIAGITFAGVQFAGSLMDMQMGLSVAQTFDPMVGAQVTIMERLLQFFCIILFINLKGHHILLNSLFNSFTLFPVASMVNISNSYILLIDLGKMIFQIGLQIAAPVVLVIFLMDFSFGIISRVAPQINVFMLGFQLKPTLGLVIFVFLLPFLSDNIMNYLVAINDNILKLFVLLQKSG